MTPDENLQELQTQNTESPAPQKHRLPTIRSAIPAVLINITSLDKGTQPFVVCDG